MFGNTSSREDPRSLLTLQTPRGSTVQVSRVQAERALKSQGISSPSSRTTRNAEVTAPYSTTSNGSPSRSRTQAPSPSKPSPSSSGRFSSTNNFQSSPSNTRKSASIRAQLDERDDNVFSSKPQRGSSSSNNVDHVGQAIQELDKGKSVPLGGFDVWPVGEIKPDYTKVDSVQQLLRTKLETLAGFSSDPAVVIKRAFKEATKGGDELTEEVFVNLVQNKYNFQGYGPEVKALFKRFDVDRSGTISVQEFLDVILTKGATSYANTIGRVREVLAKRSGGVSSLKGLALQFKIMDSSKDNRVSREELEWGLNKFLRGYGLTLTDREIDSLFAEFDVDHDGSVSYDEFIHGIRGGMNDFRKNLVKLAFDIIDEDRSGTLSVAEMASRYDVSGHPLVKAGKCTPTEAIKTFMLQWQLHSKQKDDVIDLDEFLDYYDWISMSIDRDDYFELMIRNAWHIAGGSGWSENTSNLRVLVTHMDGRQTIETIKDDLGLKRTDMEGIKARLAKQGIRAKGVSIADAADY